MTTLLLLAALAVTGVGAWLSSRARHAGNLLLALGGAGLIAVITLQVRQYFATPNAEGRDRSKMAVSFCLANCVINDTGGQSGDVLLLFPDRRDMDAETEESYENGFVPPLRHGRGKLNLKALHLPGRGHDLSGFKQALAQSDGALAIVSFAGAPDGFENLFPAGQANAPLFYAFDADGKINWLAPLKAGRIRAVVTPRPGVDARTRQSITGMPDAVFDQCCFLATQANADDVAASLKTRN